MSNNTSPWQMYDQLIEGIPAGIAVVDFCIGSHWCYVEAECGMGLAHVVGGGAKGRWQGDPCELDLRSLAEHVKSWNFSDASLGTAAINAWYASAEKIAALGGEVAFGDWKGGPSCGEGHGGPAAAHGGAAAAHGGSAAAPGGAPAAKDQAWSAEPPAGHAPIADARGDAANPFHSDIDRYMGKKVAVIGHFPNVAGMASVCDLTVLERSCGSGLDTPDSAAEFILPEQDVVYITGTTLTNKTLPRLLQLTCGAYTTLVGPSSVPCDVLLDYGVDCIDGSVVVDPASAKFAVKGGSKQQWRAGIKKFALKR